MRIAIVLSFELRSALIVAIVLIPTALLWRYRISRLDSMLEKYVLPEPIDRNARESVASVIAQAGLAIGSVLTLLLALLVVFVGLYELNGGGLPKEFADAVPPMVLAWLGVVAITATAVILERRVVQRWRWRRRARVR